MQFLRTKLGLFLAVTALASVAFSGPFTGSGYVMEGDCQTVQIDNGNC